MRNRASARVLGRFAPAFVLTITLVALGCSGGDDAPAPAAKTPPASPQAAQPAAPAPATPVPDNSEITSGFDVVPDNFPADVPIYPDSTPGPSITLPGLGLFATFESGDEIEVIVEHFRNGLTESGWIVESTADGGLEANKDARSVQIQVRPNESGRSEIGITASSG